ncbi:MAG: hypothetical protein VXY23_15885 [Pseudomonadota bacterium]|jgi:hypothetical protein|nr:hypothetical protein [Pseudomonadota bacterium]
MSMIDLDAPDITDEEREIILAYRSAPLENRVAVNLFIHGYEPEEAKRVAREWVTRAKPETQQ